MKETFQFKPRRYLHFDAPISSARAEVLATNPVFVAQHDFYPLIGFTITSPRVDTTESGVKTAKEPKARPIKLAAHADAAIYAHYAQLLEVPYEAEIVVAGLENEVTAFRKFPEKGRNNIWFSDEVFRFIENHRPCVAIALDVKKFFDRLKHQVLKDAWASVLNVDRLPADHFALFKNLTQFRWCERDEVYAKMGISRHNPRPKSFNRRRICTAAEFRTQVRMSGLIRSNPEAELQRGIPQGTPISAMLSNLYMLEFDRAMKEAVSEVGGLYRRYCDDIMLIVPPDEEERFIALAASAIGNLNLDLNTDKTERVRFPEAAGSLAEDNQRLQYLGFTFDGQKKLIRNGSLTRYYAKMRRGVKFAKLTQRKYNKREEKNGNPASDLKTRKLYNQYSYLIDRRFKNSEPPRPGPRGNFLTYAYKASRRMQAPEIKLQVRNHWTKLNAEIKKGS